ncbi:MAG: lipoxygenase family protein [Phormidesmis sp.]
MEISLPQNDPNPDQRKGAIATQQQQYQYHYVADLPGVALAKQVPPQDSSLNKFAWVRDNVSLLLRIRANQGLQDINERGLQPLFVWRLLSAIGLYRVLKDDRRAGVWLAILRKTLSVVQKVERLIGRQPKSENLEADAKAGNTDLVEERVKTLATTIQKDRKHLDKKESIQLLTQQEQRPDPLALTGASLSDYTALFKVYNDLFQLIYLPCISQDFHEDRTFAAQRVAGPNPLVIEKVQTLPDSFPVTDKHYQAAMGEQDTLAEAIAEGRLYLADYAVLADLKPSAFPKDQKYLSLPLALFAVPKGTGSLVPVAIQCGQRPGANTPIFTPPPAGTPQFQKWSWLIAKTIVQIADGNYHELISHLGRTHLLIEPFVIATARQLAPNHPLSVLLRPHFEGTLFINQSALEGLVNEGGTVDKVMAGTLESSLYLTAKGVQGYPLGFNDSMVPKTFASRGVDDPQQLPDYPYRDDALLIWDAIHQWVTDYLAIYYLDDEAVVQDTELQNWLAELISEQGGKVRDIGEPAEGGAPSLRTRAYLEDAIALVIFTASAQHAAVNFPQAAYMTYGPNMPLAGYEPAPTSPTGATSKDYLALLPPLEQAESQMNMTYPLGSLYYTRLGDYGKDYFIAPQVSSPLQKFQQRLKQIEITIDERNAHRPTHYSFLHPANIPQSINI